MLQPPTEPAPARAPGDIVVDLWLPAGACRNRPRNVRRQAFRSGGNHTPVRVGSAARLAPFLLGGLVGAWLALCRVRGSTGSPRTDLRCRLLSFRSSWAFRRTSVACGPRFDRLTTNGPEVPPPLFPFVLSLSKDERCVRSAVRPAHHERTGDAASSSLSVRPELVEG